ncbi:mannose-6-phosphate isomerase [Gorgonomyces haynaldii]|nr:mannose-6-phosphate isomerase [Gorgonomyces haynaldii]
MHRLVPKTQSYDWGKLGASSKVSELASATPGITLDPSQPYAELWMGTHPNGPNSVLASNKPLKDILNKENLTDGIYDLYQGDLPFLFKVLSIRKALSIQAHPDKKLAAKLFKEFPKIYKDPNHKPEMAVALTPFEAFINFRPLDEIAHFLKTYPEFSNVVGEQIATSFVKQVGSTDVAANKQALKALFGALQRQDPKLIVEQLDKMLKRIGNDKHDQLIKRLAEQYPGDVGVFCAFLLNYVVLAPGQGIFLAANEPHAYLSGDCVECMAASDNVVRSGLTPKFKDVETLVEMLTYNYGPADAQIMPGAPVPGNPHLKLYDPPIDEFSILEIQSRGNAQVHGVKGPSILIVTEGNGFATVKGAKHELVKGSVWFVEANSLLQVEGTLTGYQAYCAL